MAALCDSELDFLVHVANKAADAAGEVIRQYYGKELKINDKNGDGPVTVADVEAEQAMISIILQNFPSHTVFGEETGWTNINSKDDGNVDAKVSDFVWVLDPIDGTGSFISCENSLSFGTLIALLYKRKPILGCIDQPISKRRWVGVSGRTTTLNGNPVSTCACPDIGKAHADLKDPDYNDDTEHAYKRVQHKVGKSSIDGNCMAYAKLAIGELHVVVDCALDPCDFLALIPVVKGAGGVITDWEGGELCWEADPSCCSIPEWGFKVVAAGDKKTHQQVIDLLSA